MIHGRVLAISEPLPANTLPVIGEKNGNPALRAATRNVSSVFFSLLSGYRSATTDPRRTRESPVYPP